MMTNSGVMCVCASTANRSTTHTSVVCAACRCAGGREGEGEKELFFKRLLKRHTCPSFSIGRFYQRVYTVLERQSPVQIHGGWSKSGCSIVHLCRTRFLKEDVINIKANFWFNLQLHPLSLPSILSLLPVSLLTGVCTIQRRWRADHRCARKASCVGGQYCGGCCRR